MAGGELFVYAWKEWGLQVLVLLSFTFQVALLILAEFRRRMDSGVLRAIVWSAYLLADATAIYVLGHMSVIRMSREHELTAFWAPFLLLHLGGQDNITAYAIEDNRLWLRHLQTLAVQVAGAAYILYQSSIVGGGRSSSLLRSAAILMFVVGVVKYGERVWALRCVGTGPSGSNYRSFDRESGSTVKPPTRRDREAFLLRAHLLLDVPKDFISGPLRSVAAYSGTVDLSGDELYEVVEMQLSLMHDVLYTKTEVMHTWYGLCIHTILPLGTVAALTLLVLHLLEEHKGVVVYNRADVAVTYILMVGAVVLEATSAMRAAFSSWTCALLQKRSFHARGDRPRKIWDCLGRAVASIRRLVRAADWRRRYWSGCMGQHNLLRVCARSRGSRISKMARWIGVEDPWNTLAYSGPSVPVSKGIKQLLLTRVVQSNGNLDSSADHVNGQAALKRWRLYDAVSSIIRGLDLEQSILVWHIATDIYLNRYKEQAKNRQVQEEDARAGRRADLAQVVQALSNYMLFLLAERSYMLPVPTSRDAYVAMCYVITGLECGPDEDLSSLLQRYGSDLNTAPEYQFAYRNPLKRKHYSVLAEELLEKGSRLGAKFVVIEPQDSAPDMLEVIAEVWVEMLCYAGYRCSAESHAKQLSSGGELVTVAALLMKYMKRRITSEYPLISG